MKILVTGDRTWSNSFIIFQVIGALHAEDPDLFIVQGGAKGADSIAESAAKAVGAKWKTEPADWVQFGNGAGPIRNQQMLDDHPDIEWVLAFHNDLYNSKGTKDMVIRSLVKGLPVTTITLGNITWKVNLLEEEESVKSTIPQSQRIHRLKESNGFTLIPWPHRLPVKLTSKSVN